MISLKRSNSASVLLRFIVIDFTSSLDDVVRRFKLNVIEELVYNHKLITDFSLATVIITQWLWLLSGRGWTKT